MVGDGQTDDVLRRPILLAGAVVLAGCGSGSEGSTVAGGGVTPDDRGADTAVTDTAVTDTPTPDTLTRDAPTPDTEPPTTEPTDTAVADAPTADTEPSATAAPVTDAVELAPIGGRRLPETLEPGSDTAANPLPDLVVDDVGRGVDVNLRNVFPAGRPVLVWMWAPH